MRKFRRYASAGMLPVIAASFFLNASVSPAVQKPASSITEEQAILHPIDKPFKGDLDQIRKRRIIRVLVTYCKTNYFFDQGEPRGFEYEMLKAYGKFLNRKEKTPYARTRMIFLPVPFDRILSDLKKGRGDIAASSLTITPERRKIVNFTSPYIPRVNEVVIMNKHVKGLHAITDLSNRMVYIRKGSSYVTHLKALNAKLKKMNRPPVLIFESQDYIVTEDILQMVNAGIVDLTVADGYEAEAWSQVLPDIVIRKDLKINSGGQIAWAVRKGNRELLSSLNEFIEKNKKGTRLGNILFKRYYQNSKWIKNPITRTERRKLNKLMGLFKKYGRRYHFNYLALSAQAYEESGLDNAKRSPDGAIGIMQVLPETASDKNINIKNIQKLDNNIHAGSKYLNFLRTRYFSSPDIAPADRVFFSWAAYNAGPANIYKMRRKTRERGFNPNKWFFNVEKITDEFIGGETVDYVSDINKYYVAYQLYFNIYEKRNRKNRSLRKK